MIKIEVIAIVKDKIYSIGRIDVSKKGDVYWMNKINGSDMHISRHSSGKMHHKSMKENFYYPIRKSTPIKKFKGFESIGTICLNVDPDELSKTYKECRMKKRNGIFAIDMRAYKNSAFNMALSILTEEGLETLYNSWKKMKKRQIFLFTESKPMIALSVCDAKKINNLPI